MPAFGCAHLVDEAGRVLGNQHPHPAERRAHPGAVQHPYGEERQRDHAVHDQRCQHARQRPPASVTPLTPQPRGRRGNQVSQDERQERHQQDAGGGELIEDDGQYDEGDEQRTRDDVGPGAPPLAAAGRLAPTEVVAAVEKCPVGHAQL